MRAARAEVREACVWEHAPRRGSRAHAQRVLRAAGEACGRARLLQRRPVPAARMRCSEGHARRRARQRASVCTARGDTRPRLAGAAAASGRSGCWRAACRGGAYALEVVAQRRELRADGGHGGAEGARLGDRLGDDLAHEGAQLLLARRRRRPAMHRRVCGEQGALIAAEGGQAFKKGGLTRSVSTRVGADESHPNHHGCRPEVLSSPGVR